ncbi:Protein of unknown function [Poseidonocella pacifica]|uniref:DUF3168 domain-containing protein n=1 Tax=Poseidonocella pacifica TaxID=871651 RepID=A0A1I0VQ44_9RHOB|nr:DUF3168 domain-containing protein [Poseidonocella pacifica]SFA78103.1 Protein of unknown function [Poseidonocella pacifica]
MTYALSAALQKAVYQHLAENDAVRAEVGTAIYDAIPSGIPPSTYIALGPEDVRDRSDNTSNGAEHRFVISVVTDTAGFRRAKSVAGAISDALHRVELNLDRGRLIGMHFVRAQARRQDKGAERRIDLTFRARVEDD